MITAISTPNLTHTHHSSLVLTHTLPPTLMLIIVLTLALIATFRSYLATP